MLSLSLPFSVDALQSALRAHLSRPGLSVVDVDVAPGRLAGGHGYGSSLAGGQERALRLDVSYDDIAASDAERAGRLSLVLKPGVGEAGAESTANEPGREAGFYRSLAPGLAMRTPRVLLASAGGEWLLMEAVPFDAVWPRAAWSEGQYRAALDALAAMHAQWWGRPPDPAEYPWVWQPLGAHAPALAEDARAALLEIERAPWREAFFPGDRLRAWLRVVEEPAVLLDLFEGVPQTLVHGDYWPGNIAVHRDGPAVFDWQRVGVGPAAYDLACFYGSSRWWFGRLPLSLAEIRAHYLRALNERLGTNLDRYLFDQGTDAARAWQFAVLWPAALLEHHAHLLGVQSHVRATVTEPAWACLRRCVG